MKFLSSCFILAVFSSISFSTTVSAQETGNDQKIAQMQSVISNLQLELESMKAAQTPAPAYRTQINAPTVDQRVLRNEPTPAQRVPRNEPTPAAYPLADFAAPQAGYYPPAYSHPQYRMPPIEPVYLHQPPVVVVEPAYCPHGGYCDSGYGRGGNLYVGPNGWGLGVGGLQLDFWGHGGHGHGGGSHKGHKGHKKH